MQTDVVPAAVREGRSARIVVLISGTGTNLRALLDACADPAYGVSVVGVISDRADAGGLSFATAAGVPTAVVPLPSGATGSRRDDWDQDLAGQIDRWSPDLVVSAGFMRLLGRRVLAAYPHRVVNTHPALLPSFPGTHAVRDALAYGVRVTGATVHLVDEGVDTGPVLDQVAVAVQAGDSEASLHERIKVEERRMLVATVGRIARHGYEVTGRQVTVR